ncbi:MAG: ATP-binding protein [Chloroflexota bacterium]|nr:ATP-binding protein [Chloroflexota bacterium]
MKQLVILSGKGGTGKTSVAASLSHLASSEASVVMADADVDASNLELLLAPTKLAEHAFISGKLALLDQEACIDCGRCAEVCRFDAVLNDGETYRIDPVSCEGCATCFYECPVNAITMHDRESGQWFQSQTRFGMLFHARLYAGQENSGKLVTVVKQQANLWADDHEADYVIVDGPPGIGCPVIAACSGAQMALLVVEPTVSGAHDLERILATTEHFRVPAAVVVNKFDINLKRTEGIAEFCAANNVPVVGKVPFDVAVTEAMVRGLPITEADDGQVSQSLEQVWREVKETLNTREKKDV